MSMKSKLKLAAIMSAASILGSDMPIMERKKPTGKLNGHSPWLTAKDAKVKKWRKKEKSAKQARKINWK